MSFSCFCFLFLGRQKIIATKKARSEELKRRDVEKQVASFHNHTPEELEERRQKKKKRETSISYMVPFI